MINSEILYPVLIALLSIVSITLGFVLLLFSSSKEEVLLQTYRKARKALAWAFLILGIFNILEAVLAQIHPSEEEPFNIANVCLIIASFQACLFTYASIVLMSPSFSKEIWTKRQLCIISGLSTAVLVGFFFDRSLFHYLLLALFSIFYTYQLIFYTRLFLRKKREYLRKVDHYFSGMEGHWLRWVNTGFFMSLATGIGAFFLILFPEQYFSLIFTFFCTLFYVFFAGKYLEYPRRFYRLQPIISPEKETDIYSDIPVEEKRSLEDKLEIWISQKRFLQNSLSIDMVAEQIGVNRYYLSFYIIAHLQMNFKSWINYLRQKEQQILLKEKASQTGRSSALFAKTEQRILEDKLFLNADLSRNELAKILNTNTVYLCDEIKRYTGLTFGEYINGLRLEHARELLREVSEVETSIMIIAVSSGFKSMRTFNRIFKERFGITPSEIRKNASF